MVGAQSPAVAVQSPTAARKRASKRVAVIGEHQDQPANANAHDKEIDWLVSTLLSDNFTILLILSNLITGNN